MNSRPVCVALLVITSLGASVPAQSADDDNASGESSAIPEFSFDASEYGDRWITGDRNDDGITDYALLLDEENLKLKEAVDFNDDGYMDDFYYYSNEVLIRQEIDTNYDQSVDLWVYLHRGVYVERYERDTDHDGKPDIVKDFDESEQ